MGEGPEIVIRHRETSLFLLNTLSIASPCDPGLPSFPGSLGGRRAAALGMRNGHRNLKRGLV